MKKAFTIIELLLVVAIISVLITIVTGVASSSVKMARARKAETTCALVQAGLATYHAQKDEWPVEFGNVTSNVYELSAGEVKACVLALVNEAKKGNPVMDVTGLFVSKESGEPSNRPQLGLDFVEALRGTKQSKKKMKVAQMNFGYPESEHGWFRRFRMVYSVSSDSITVTRW